MTGRARGLFIVVSLLACYAIADDRPFDPHHGPAARGQHGLVLATNGDTWMAAWQDDRAGAFDVYVSPLDDRGQPLRPDGIPIATGSCDATGVDIDWTGESYTVSWIIEGSLFAAQVSTGGDVVRAAAKILDLPSQSGFPAFEWNGSRYLSAWPVSEGNFASSHVEGLIVDSQFQAVTPPFRISDAPVLQPTVRVSAGEGRFLAIWSNRTGATSYETRTAIVASDAAISSRHVLQETAGGELAWNGSSWAMVWDSSDGHVRFTTIDAGGSPSGTITVLPADWVSGPDVAWDGANFLVAFSGYRGPIFTLRVSSTGVPIDAGPVPLTDSSLARVADMSRNAHGVLVGWNDYRTGMNPFDSLVPASPTGARPPEQLLATSLEEQQKPAIATDGTLGLVVWSEIVDSNTPAVRAVRVNSAGVQLETAPLELQRGFEIGAIAVGASTDGFLVAWTASIGNIDHLFIARVSRAGEILDAPVEIGQTSQGLAVASDGSNFLVVWSAGGSRIVGSSVPWGAPAAVPFTIAEPQALNTALYAPDVVFDGSGFVTSWLSATSCGRSCYFQDAYVASVSTSSVSATTRLGSAAGAPKLASNGARTIVAWPFGNVTIALLDRDLHEVARAAAGSETAHPADVDVVWGGTRWLATWTAFDSDEWSACLRDSRSHIESASFAADLSDPVAAPMTSADDGSRRAALAAAGGGALLVYERFVPTAPALHRGGISRIFLRALGVARHRATVR